MVDWVRVIGLAGINVWCRYLWCVCPYLDNEVVDLSDIWLRHLEGVAVVGDGVWQEVGAVLTFYVFSTVYYLRLWGSKVVLVVELICE